MLIDLTAPLNEETPVYPGDPKTVIEPAGVAERDGYTDHKITLATHVGTHIDAPAHMLADGNTLDRYPVARFTGRGVYIDTRRGFDSVLEAKLRSGDIVLLHTGWAERYHDPAYFTDYSAIPAHVAAHLIERKVSMVGMDMAGPDYDPFPIHRQLLKADVLIAENLTNLELLAGKEFRVYALPLRLDLDGAPARIVAEIT
jgi:arylformamidase